jgi:hypothetical protein
MKKTNEEFLVHVLNYSKGGPMVHMIIVHAITSYIGNVLKEDRATFSLGALNSFINPQSWWDSCNELKKEFDQQYEHKEPSGHNSKNK